MTFEVEDFDAAVKRLHDHAITLFLGPTETKVCQWAAFRDPDGNRLVIHKPKRIFCSLNHASSNRTEFGDERKLSADHASSLFRTSAILNAPIGFASGCGSLFITSFSIYRRNSSPNM